MKRKWLASLVLLSLLVVAVPSWAGDTNVYGDPGSDSFSTAMAVTADASGNVYTMGVFFGEFQGVTSTGWDVWMARVAPSGSFEWVVTWDAPEINNTDFSQLPIEKAWTTTPGEMLVEDGGRLVGMIGWGTNTVVTASPDGRNPTHQEISPHGLDGVSLNEATLVGGASPGLVGWDSKPDSLHLVRVGLDESVEWSTAVSGGFGYTTMALSDGTIVAGIRLARLGFQKPAVKVVALSEAGEMLWDTTIYDACFQESGNPLVELGDTIGVLLNPPQVPYPSLCDPDTETVSTLDPSTGAVVADRTMRDTLNLIWCDDPRNGVISNAIGTGFVDGDECGGDDVFWTDVNNVLIDTGSEIEAFAIMGMEIVNEGYLGYGVLRSVVEGDRWVLEEFEYLAPSLGMMPYDMVVTDEGPVVVGRAFNTAWVGATTSSVDTYALAASGPGAATLVTSGFVPSGRFLDDNTSVFETDIEWMAATGITKGCNPPANSLFCPDANVTRGQMAAFLTRALGLTERLDDPFIDDDDSVFEADIEKLAAAGITRGCNPPTNDRFCPDSRVTREVMAAFLVRALGYSDDGGGDLFVDDDDSIFEADIDRLGTAGVTRGCNPPTNDRFCPKGNVTRGQMAAFLHRALG